MVTPSEPAPERGDVVWLNFDPGTGHEQAGRRPAVVISPRVYNEKVGLAVFCPVTSAVKGYPYEVTLPKGLKVAGVILSDQAKSLEGHSGFLRYPRGQGREERSPHSGLPRRRGREFRAHGKSRRHGSCPFQEGVRERLLHGRGNRQEGCGKGR